MYEEIDSLLPPGYDVYYEDMPPEGFCACIRQIDERFILAGSTTDPEGSTEVDIQIYLRVAASYVNMKKSRQDLKSVFTKLQTTEQLGNKIIASVTGGSVLDIGKDEKDNMDFSINFTVRYSI